MATANWFGLAGRDQWGATAADRVDWVTDTIKVTLHTVTYVPAQDTDQYFAAATNELGTAGGYTAGGATLASKTLTYDTATNEVRLKAATTTWANATFTARIAVVRKDTGVAATSHLISWVDFTANQSPAGVDFSIVWDATSGVVKATVA